jgi:hypothetical protein
MFIKEVAMVHHERIPHALPQQQPLLWLWRRSHPRILAMSIAIRVWSILLTMGENKARHRRSP